MERKSGVNDKADTDGPGYMKLWGRPKIPKTWREQDPIIVRRHAQNNDAQMPSEEGLGGAQVGYEIFIGERK